MKKTLLLLSLLVAGATGTIFWWQLNSQDSTSAFFWQLSDREKEYCEKKASLENTDFSARQTYERCAKTVKEVFKKRDEIKRQKEEEEAKKKAAISVLKKLLLKRCNAIKSQKSVEDKNSQILGFPSKILNNSRFGWVTNMTLISFASDCSDSQAESLAEDIVDDLEEKFWQLDGKPIPKDHQSKNK